MTPTQIEDFARQKFNATNDTFFTQAEMLNYMYQASMELAVECLVIERTYSTTTVASQQEYAFPTNVIAVKRVTYNGQKLEPIDMRKDDRLTLNNQSTTSTGNPQYYFQWNETFSLRPIPDAANTLKVWGYVEPSSISATSTLDVPSMWHLDIVDFCLKEMNAKDENFQGAAYYEARWERAKGRAKRWSQKKKRADGFAVVRDEESEAITLIGTV